MMNYLFKFVLFGTLLLGLFSCDFLRYDETRVYKKEDVFTNFDRSKQFLNNIYSRLPEGFNTIEEAMRASATDNAEEIWEFAEVHRFNNGSWSASQPVSDAWTQMYKGIRAANRFLEEIEGEEFEDRRYNDDYDQMREQLELFPYEARFLRAFFYFELAKRYGGVPLITDVPNAERANTVEPSSFEQVVDFIVSECNAIMSELPVSYNSVAGSETGRATRGAAMALKSRALLYAASPLHNPEGNRENWVDAARAAKAIIDSGYYSLEGNYSSVVNFRLSNELIFERRNEPTNFFEQSNFPVGYEGAQPGTAPSQNLVDAYEMQSTGLPIEASGSGYDPNNPYEDRDPRLYQTVILNNSSWKGRTVEIWNGGIDGPPKNRATVTGYYLKKYVIESVSLSPELTTRATHTWVFFRYGEILLNYAEAMNEAYGPEDAAGMGMTAREAVNMIRNRVNMPDFPTGMSQEAFRQKLRNERRVELAFEDHRFWDLRRWRIGPSTTEIYGMEITQNDDGSFDYQRKLVEERVWEERMNLFPIPQSEIYINENLEQNPGW